MRTVTDDVIKKKHTTKCQFLLPYTFSTAVLSRDTATHTQTHTHTHSSELNWQDNPSVSQVSVCDGSNITTVRICCLRSKACDCDWVFRGWCGLRAWVSEWVSACVCVHVWARVHASKWWWLLEKRWVIGSRWMVDVGCMIYTRGMKVGGTLGTVLPFSLW